MLKVPQSLCWSHFLKFYPIFSAIFMHEINLYIFTDEIACADPDICEDICGSRTGCTNIAYPLMVIRLLPVGEW